MPCQDNLINARCCQRVNDFLDDGRECRDIPRVCRHNPHIPQRRESANPGCGDTHNTHLFAGSCRNHDAFGDAVRNGASLLPGINDEPGEVAIGAKI